MGAEGGRCEKQAAPLEEGKRERRSEMERFRKIWAPIDKGIFTALKYICAGMLSALILIVFYIFIGRYILHDSPMWGEPLSLLLLSWMSILGSALVLRTDEHLRVTMFDNKLSKKQMLLTDILTLLCVLAFAGFMIFYGAHLMKQARSNTIAGINVPYAWMYASLPVTGVLYIFALVSQWVGRLEQK